MTKLLLLFLATCCALVGFWRCCSYEGAFSAFIWWFDSLVIVAFVFTRNQSPVEADDERG